MTKRKSFIAKLAYVLIFSLALIFSTTLSSETITVQAEDKILIDFVEAEITVPVAGETVNTSVTVGGILYKATVKWYKGTEIENVNQMFSSEKFVEGLKYTAVVKFQVVSFSEYAFDTVNITANINGQHAEIKSASAAFVNAYYTFTLDAAPTPSYTVTIINGTFEDGRTSGSFKSGEEVTIIADTTQKDKLFCEWIADSDDGDFDNPYIETTKYTIGESDVEIKAVLKTIIRSIELTIKTPVSGEVFDNNKDLSTPSDSRYTATLTWHDESKKELVDGTMFELGSEYFAIIDVYAADDYAFTKDTIAYLNGLEDFKFDCVDGSFQIRAFFTTTEKPRVYYDVKVIGGSATIDESNVIKAESGDEITITIDHNTDKEFEKWVVISGGVTLADDHSSTTIFTMGSSNVEIKATYKHIHDYGTLIAKRESTCATKGMQAHYECLTCHKLFDGDKTEKTAEQLEIAINPNAHDLEVTWTKVDKGHYHICKNGCVEGHDGLQAHEPDREAPTETDPIKCTVCGYIIIPVTGHTHNLTAVSSKNATCMEDGRKAYYACTGCELKFKDEAGTEEITNESWLVIPKAHRFGEWIEEVPATTKTAGIKAHKDCEFCHKHFDEHDTEIEDLTVAKLPGDGKNSSAENKGLNGGAIAGIVIGSVAVVGLGGFAIFWFVIKKKSFTELIIAIKCLFKKK